ncbi:helix-turn-helix domain-containing protein [uncultured Ferrimonas sp.]|uniref:helix-turn-helix domain-containing protein n=1 Tax=uncultured Ferrimonas sp. TaxID=432640 RepID=UPI002634049C|nr:helix-turn-helix domain-containing protein [uncultured Ferrimonas sp.]
MQRMAQRFAQTGTVDQLTMRKIDALAMQDKLDGFNAQRIQALRAREGISQGVLAMVLNMSSESVKKWEQGKSKPQGAALRLLSIIDRNGISAVI